MADNWVTKLSKFAFAGGGGGSSGGGAWGPGSPAKPAFKAPTNAKGSAYTSVKAPAPQTPTENNTNNTTSAASAPADPYAAWGGTAAYQNLLNNFRSQKTGIYNTSRDAANNFGLGYRDSILDFVGGLKSGQNAINSKAAQNELAKMQGVQGVQGMVGRGVKSSGVMLGNKNAGNSSAAGALAGAYGDIGRRELASVGNQYEMGNEDIRLQQGALDQQRESGVRKLNTSKTQTINDIVSQARDKFAALDAAMADKSLPERIAIDQEKESVRQQILQSLQAYDQQLQEGLGGIKANSADDRRAEASRLGAAGTDLGKDAFTYTTETPAELQGTGPFASSLPLFSAQKPRKDI